jgi:putative ATPase
MDLPFPESDSQTKRRPLADRMRPATLDDFVGQEQIVGPGKLLRRSLEAGRLSQSIVLWGPPGCGKTTLARLIAASVESRFVTFSAVTSGIADVKRVIADAGKLRSIDERPLLLFVDEIHRFNKAQQDAFLPHIEDGTIVFIGATTENPSFEVIGPLLSRSRVFVLEALDAGQIERILERALLVEEGIGGRFTAEEGALAFVADQAQGDARVALNALEYAGSVLEKSDDNVLTRALFQDALQRRMVTSDKAGESHFNLISALHKSLRGSDVDASLYWLARMCEAGEDPMYIARRLVRFASEDVGVADPQGLSQALAAKQAVEFVGYPECKLALAQAVVYLALAPKSNSLYTAYDGAANTVLNNPPYPVPKVIRNAPTRLMKDLGYGKDYKYPHDHPDNLADQEYLPDELKGKRFYHPKSYGFERDLKKRLEYFLSRKSPPPKKK